jgi:hypothetical protein
MTLLFSTYDVIENRKRIRIVTLIMHVFGSITTKGNTLDKALNLLEKEITIEKRRREIILRK